MKINDTYIRSSNFFIKTLINSHFREYFPIRLKYLYINIFKYIQCIYKNISSIVTIKIHLLHINKNLLTYIINFLDFVKIIKIKIYNPIIK